MFSPDSVIFPDSSGLAVALAEELADGIAAAAHSGSRFILGCPGGRTPRETYLALASEVGRRGLPLDHLVIAMMDDYVLPRSGGFVPVDASAHYSCRRFAAEEIAAPLNAHALRPVTDVWLPDPADPAAYDDRLKQAGGVDVFLLASGESDGHVAFNPPGTPRTATTRVVRLADTTRTDNLRTFPDFNSLADVPTHGVTVGPATIADLSRRLILILVGPHKHTAFTRTTTATTYDPTWPATIITEGASSTIYADQPAATP